MWRITIEVPLWDSFVEVEDPQNLGIVEEFPSWSKNNDIKTKEIKKRDGKKSVILVVVAFMLLITLGTVFAICALKYSTQLNNPFLFLTILNSWFGLLELSLLICWIFIIRRWPT